MYRGRSCGSTTARSRIGLCLLVVLTAMLATGTSVGAQVAVANATRIVTLRWEDRSERDPARRDPLPPPDFCFRCRRRPVTIEWDPPSSGLPLKHYVFEAGRAAGATDAGIILLPPHLTRFTFNAVAEGNYYLRLRAVNQFGTSPPSEELILVCAVECGQLPGPVRQLAVQVLGRRILLTWQAPEHGATVTEYIAEFGSSRGLSNLGEFATGSALPVVAIDGVPPGHYSVRVRAIYMGNAGPPSDDVVVDVNRP